MVRVFFMVLLILFVGSVEVRAAAGGREVAAPGESRKIVLDEKVGGFRRSFRLHLPAGSVGDVPRPLIVALHGGFATARILEKQSGWSDVADREGLIVAYPNGFGFFSLARHWNGGYCCAKAMKAEFDELGFLDRVINWITQRHAVDRRRVFVVGYSNGGMLAHWYAAARADQLAGLGIWASSIGSLETPERSWVWPDPRAVLPVVIAHGKADDRLPYEEPPYEEPRARKGQRLLGAVGSARSWARANGCEEEAVVESSSAGAVQRHAWCGGGEGPVVLLSLAAWGHDWPGPNLTDKLPSTEPLHGFHLAEEMWRYFRDYRRHYIH